MARLYFAAFNRHLAGGASYVTGNKALREASSLFKAWRFDEALAQTDAVLRKAPDNIKAMHLRADILVWAGRRSEAERVTRSILERDPLDLNSIIRLRAIGIPYTFDKGLAQKQIQQEKEGLGVYTRAIEYLVAGGFLDEAKKTVETGLKIISSSPRPNEEVTANFVYLQGTALLSAGRFDEANAAFESVSESQFSRKAASLRARCLLEMGRGADAEALLRELGANPGQEIRYHGTLFAALLQQNRIEEAHRLYRLRSTSEALAKYFEMPVPSSINILDAANKEKDALIVAEGGPGDEIRFASMYDQVASCFRSATISCDPRLHSILQRSFPSINFLPAQRYRKEVLSADILGRSTLTDMRLYTAVSDEVFAAGRQKQLVCSALDLLADLRKHRGEFKNCTSRLNADPNLQKQWNKRIRTSGRMQIGIAWRSLLLSKDRNRHYLTVEDLRPFSALNNVDFWILQAGVTHDEVRYLSEFLNVRMPDVDLKDDFEGQAAVIANLDAVVSPLTTMAELSGMLNAPTLIFCRTPEAIWRKNSDGTDVWYPSARLVVGEPIHDPSALVDKLTRWVVDWEHSYSSNP